MTLKYAVRNITITTSEEIQTTLLQLQERHIKMCITITCLTEKRKKCTYFKVQLLLALRLIYNEEYCSYLVVAQI